ncbi:tryptase-2-like [Enoplosus armatus]|uniref:tryptase-2-like n=1 Tax=Enoplosus armatus TaxID=215367 RepID=UPI003993EB0C
MAVCKLLAALALVISAGGLLEGEVRSSIVGGEEAPQGRWPWVVHLNITTDDRLLRWRCGAAILNDQWLLTSASCWDKRRKPSLARTIVWLGAHNLRQGSARFMAVLFVISHPGYRALGGGYMNNIALVKLRKKVKFSPLIAPVSLPSVNTIFGLLSECWIAGWGSIGDGDPLLLLDTLQQQKIPILPRSVCEVDYPELTSDMLCAGGVAAGKNVWKGDYGGPLVCCTGSDFVLVGIMSYRSVEGCGLMGRPSVYTQVSKYLSFINDYIHS